jgi:hypothetical protein
MGRPADREGTRLEQMEKAAADEAKRAARANSLPGRLIAPLRAPPGWMRRQVSQYPNPPWDAKVLPPKP